MFVVQTPMQMPTHIFCDTPAHSHMLLDGSEIIPSLLPIFIPCFFEDIDKLMVIQRDDKYYRL